MISVCLTTYNGNLFLKEQIDSILCQLNCKQKNLVCKAFTLDKQILV